MSDNLRPVLRPRFNRLDARFTRRRRGRYVAGCLAIAIFVFVSIGPLKTPLKNRGSAHRAAAQALAQSQTGPVPLATVSGMALTLVLPAAKKDITSIGYHQAYNVRALSLIAKTASIGQATTQAVAAAVRSGDKPAFVMTARGRGSALDSAVDIVLKAGTVVKSPVTGQVLEVVPYLLYGRINDVRVEIIADGYPAFKVAVVHIDKPTVTAGQKVEAGVTPLATVRPLGISSQIDQYLGEAVTHVHIQVNPIETKPSASHVD